MLQNRRRRTPNAGGFKAGNLEPIQLSLMQDSPCLRVRITDNKKRAGKIPCPAYLMEIKEEELLLHLDRLYRDVVLVVGCAFDHDFVTDVLLR